MSACARTYRWLRGTADILRPEALGMSPLLGLASQMCPMYAANLRVYPNNEPAAMLARELFYQRQDLLGIRYGPVSVCKSRSKAAYWITPYAAGYFLGLSLSFSEDGGQVNFNSHFSDLLENSCVILPQ